MRNIVKYFSIIILLNNWAFAQQIPDFKKQHYIDSTSGNIYWNKKIPFAIKVFSTVGNDEVTLFSNQQTEIYFDTEGKNSIYSPWLVNAKNKEYVYPRTNVEFIIFADGIAPTTTIKLLNAPTFSEKNTTFIGKGLNVVMQAIDKTSGVKELIYSINNKPYKKYRDTINFDTEGNFELKFLAIDNVGNIGEIKNTVFTLDLSAPKTFHSITNIDLKNNVIPLSSKITLQTEDNLSGIKKTLYSIDNGVKHIYKGGIIPIHNLSNGDHTITYYSVDNVDNIEQQKELAFYLDKVAPILSSDILGDRYVVNDQIYFSGRTKLKLTAVDNKSGVKNIMYSINKEPYKPYTDPFYLPSREGLHTVEYYALDNTGNSTGQEVGTTIQAEEFKHKVIKKIFTDLVGPSLNHKFSGVFYATRDTVFVSTKTKIQLSAIDGESGLQYISYSINANREEIRYSEPFSISEKGLHEIEFFAYDNVNNRNKSSFNCFVDNDPPIIYKTFSIPPIAKKNITTNDTTDVISEFDVYPSYVNIYLAAKDITIGSDKIFYSLNDGKRIPYRNKIEGFIKNRLNKIKVWAVDKLGNQCEEDILFYVSD